jgi:hypothetical protein
VVAGGSVAVMVVVVVVMMTLFAACPSSSTPATLLPHAWIASPTRSKITLVLPLQLLGSWRWEAQEVFQLTTLGKLSDASAQAAVAARVVVGTCTREEAAGLTSCRPVC